MKDAERGRMTATPSQARQYYYDRALKDQNPFHRRTEKGRAKLVDRQLAKLFKSVGDTPQGKEATFKDFLRAEASTIITQRYLPEEATIGAVSSAFNNKIVEGGALDGTPLILTEDQVDRIPPSRTHADISYS